MHLINRLPTFGTTNKSPYHILFNEPPNYSILRVFGCLCYPWLKPHVTSKLTPRSTSCIYLEFSSQFILINALILSHLKYTFHVTLYLSSLRFHMSQCFSISLIIYPTWIRFPLILRLVMSQIQSHTSRLIILFRIQLQLQHPFQRSLICALHHQIPCAKNAHLVILMYPHNNQMKVQAQVGWIYYRHL